MNLDVGLLLLKQHQSGQTNKGKCGGLNELPLIDDRPLRRLDGARQFGINIITLYCLAK